MIIWPAKDPDEVADYSWTPGLDEGDTIASHTVTLDDGDVTIDSDAHTGTKVTVWLSGGTVGVSTFTLRVTTAGGRTFETAAQIAVADSSSELLTAFRIRFPAFAAVPASTVQYWLTDAGLTVTNSWIEADYQPALLTLAAHNMAMQGLDRPSGDTVGSLAQMGVTGFKSASMSVNFDADTVQRANSGGYSATKYGQQFAVYLRRNVGGPRLVGGCGYPYPGLPG